MSANNTSRALALDHFLANFLPYGISDEDHARIATLLWALRFRLVRELRERGELDPEDEDDRPMRTRHPTDEERRDGQPEWLDRD